MTNPSRDDQALDHPLLTNQSNDIPPETKSQLAIQSQANTSEVNVNLINNHSEKSSHVEEGEEVIQKLRKVKIMPLFFDSQLERASTNYGLYDMFFFLAILILFVMLLAMFFTWLIFLWFCTKFTYTEKEINDGWIIANAIMGFFSYKVLPYLTNYIMKKISKQEPLIKECLSEAVCSGLLIGLPLDITTDDIEQYFKEFLAEKGRVGGVYHTLILQDYREHYLVKEKLTKLEAKLKELYLDEEQVNLPYKKEAISNEIRKVKEEKKYFSARLEQVEDDLRNFKLFKGKAIVTFDNIDNYLQAKLTDHTIKGTIVFFQDLDEPRNILFENMHQKDSIICYRSFLAYSLSTMVAFIGFIMIISLKDIKDFSSFSIKYEDIFARIFLGRSTSAVDKEAGIEKPLVTSFYVSVGIIVLDIVIKWLYKSLKQLERPISRIRYDLRMLNFGIYSALILYVTMQSSYNGVGEFDIWAKYLRGLVFIVFVKRILVKCFRIWAFKAKQEAAKNKDSLYYKMMSRFHYGHEEFDAIGHITKSLPLLYMGSCGMVIAPFTIGPMVIVFLICIYCVDKYMMTQCTEKYTPRSIDYMLETYKALNACNTTIYFTSAFIGTLFLSISSMKQKYDFIVVPLIVFFFGFCSDSIKVLIVTNISKSHAGHPVQSFCANPKVTYRGWYPNVEAVQRRHNDDSIENL